MVLLKTVGITIRALVRLENSKRHENMVSANNHHKEGHQQQASLYPATDPQKVLESYFIELDAESMRGITSRSGMKENSRSKSGSKSDLFESLGSEGADGFRYAKQRRRNHPGSLSLTRQLSIFERADAETPPLLMFQRAVRKIIVMLRVVGKRKERPKVTDRNMLSWTTICDDLGFTRTRYNNLGLSFDPTDFKVKKKGHISSEAIETLCLHPRERTRDQIRHCLVSLHTTIPAFSEFPKKMQTSLVQVGWYEKFEAGRVIIRQGQHADNFYLILSGQAVVTILEAKPKTKVSKHDIKSSEHEFSTDDTKNERLEQIQEEDCPRNSASGKGEQYVRTARILDKGKSFGEIALIHGSIRTATVTCRTEVELLALDRPDFINIFMKMEHGREPDHIQFLKSLDILKGWPIDAIPWNDPKICAFTYVRRETVLCHNSNSSELIFVISSGSCRVLKSLPAAKPKLYRGEVTEYGLHTPRTNRTENIKVRTVPRDQAKLSIARHQKTTKLEADIALSRSNISLSTVVKKSPEQVAADSQEHINIINDVFRKRHALPPIETNPSHQNASETSKITQRCEPGCQKENDEQVYIQMTKLGRGDIFGLEQVVLKGIGETTSSTLISEGAECILINKLFFRKHLTQDIAKQIRKKIQPFPTEERLQQKLQTQIDWNEFKTLTVLDYMDFNKHVQNVSWKH